MSWLDELFRWKRRSGLDRFAQFADRHSSQVIGRIQTLIEAQIPGFPVERARLMATQAADQGRPDDERWDAIHQLDVIAFKHERGADLRNHVLVLEEEYQEIFGGDTFGTLLARRFPGQENTATTRTEDPELQSWGSTLAEELQYRYSVLWVLESMRRGQRYVVLGLLVLWGAAVYGSWTVRQTHGMKMIWPMLFSVMAAGAFGAITLMLRRLQVVEWKGNPDIAMIDVRGTGWLLVLKTVVAAIFALLLYLLFAGNLVAGDMFPELKRDCLHACMYCRIPTDGGQLGKLLFWSFLAGYSEKFVPSRLEQLEKQAGGSS
jgi:hypothetical protein